MGRKPKPRPTFFKVLIRDFTSKLNLPRAFVQKHGGLLPETAKLKANSGETWNVNLEEIGDEICFLGGWNKFAQDANMEMGEFLVFWYNTRDSSFDISVYETSACKREISIIRIPPSVQDSDTDHQDSQSSGAGNISDDLEEEIMHPRMKVVLTYSKRCRLYLHKEFVEAANLANKQTVLLEYPPKERYWPVILVSSCPPFYSSLELAAGWSSFVKENRLVFGKMYSFEFNPSKNVIQVMEEGSK